MDCDLARQLIAVSRPGSADLDAADRLALDRHFATCPDCETATAAGRAFDAAIARAMRTVPVPDNLPARLHTRLFASRMAFYRRVVIRCLLVGSIVLAGWAGWTAWRTPTLAPERLARQAYEQSGQSRSSEEARDTVKDWLRQVDSRLQAPDDFNYKLFSFACRSDFQGLTGVPTLVFARNDTTMRVYVVREHAFKDLGAFREPVWDGGCTVEARRYSTMPGWVFVVVTSGAPPDDFRPPSRPGFPV